MSVSAADAIADRRERLRTWLPLLVALGAFVLGMLLFVLLWWLQRDRNEFYRPDATPTSAQGRQFEPLPAPLPARGGDAPGASGLENEAPPQPAPVPEIAPQPEPEPVATPAPVAEAPTVADAAPQAIHAPAPVYPRAAQRRHESGTVLLRVHVAADGSVDDIELAQGSGSRLLDRAARDAVRRWRFSPALRDGQPVAGVVQVPIDFDLER